MPQLLLLFIKLVLMTTIANSFFFPVILRKRHLERQLPAPSHCKLQWRGSVSIESRHDDVVARTSIDDYNLNLIIESLEVFRKCYGSGIVPLRFEVPAKDPWPVQLHGLPLGQMIEDIYSNEEFKARHPEKLQLLSSLGCGPAPTSTTTDEEWQPIIAALRVFHKLYGHTRVQVKFVVPAEEPWPRSAYNLRLGNRVASMRSAGRYVRDRPDRSAELAELGFEWTIRDAKYDIDDVLEALRTYKRVQNSVQIPHNFVVPSSHEWPENLHGMQLGKAFQENSRDGKHLKTRSREAEELLSEFSLSWRNDLRSSGKRFDVIYEALKCYRSIYGNLDVPYGFVIPSNEPWPMAAYGLKLGTRVQSIRLQGTFIANSPEKRNLLTQLGFVWEDRSRRASGGSSGAHTLPTLAKMRGSPSLADHTLEREGSLSEEPTWEKDSDVHFQWFAPPSMWDENAELLFHILQAEDQSELANNVTRGNGQITALQLGNMLSSGLEKSQQLAMKALKHRYIEFEGFGWPQVVEALMVYSSYFGNVNVSPDFVVSDDIVAQFPRFSRLLKGLELGECVEAIKRGDVDGFHDDSRRALLDTLGLDWGDQERRLLYRFPAFLWGLRVLKQLRRPLLLSEDFVVPDEPMWPLWMVGVPLGEWAALCRMQQETLDRFYPERKQLLNDLGFVWWIPPSGDLIRKYGVKNKTH